MAIIVPCAGKSSRFPKTRPKYLLTMYDGQLMLQKCIENIKYNKQRIYFVILKEHDYKYGSKKLIEKIFNNSKKIKVVVLQNETSGPAETVYKISKKLASKEPLYIKDCDSFFNQKFKIQNSVAVVNLNKNKKISNISAKSFVTKNSQDLVTNIVEKSVVSNLISVGGYSFAKSEVFNEAYREVSKNVKTELFVSNIIRHALIKTPFISDEVTNYVDVGTYDDFVNYNHSHPTIFCDIDGTIVFNQSKFFKKNNYLTEAKPIPNAIKFLLKKQSEGSFIIFTTSRDAFYKKVTNTLLKKHGFKNFKIIFNLPHSPRVVINDHDVTNPYPTAISINPPRDNNEYWSKFDLAKKKFK